MAKKRVVSADLPKYPPCIFCGAPANSKEHLWQRWLMKRIRQLTGPGRIEGEERKRPIKPRTSLQLAGIVCERTCNNGWMRQLENETIPVLSPLIAGTSCQLATPQQLTLGTWTMLRAICFDCKAPPRFFDARETGHLRAEGTPPHSTFGVWLGYSTRKVVFTEGKYFTGVKTDGSPAEGYVVTLCFGHAVIQALTIRRDYANPFTQFTVSAARGPWDEALIRVWPLPLSTVEWPPKMGFDPAADGFSLLANRFTPGKWPWKESLS